MKLRSLCFFIFCWIFVFVVNTTVVQAEDAITVYIDKEQLQLDVQPQIQNGRTLLPFRAAAEALHIDVAWDPVNRQIIADDGQTRLLLTIDSLAAYINGNETMMEAAPVILAGRTLIPARFFSETYHCQVDWDHDSRIVTITSPPADLKITGFYALGDEKTSSWVNLFNSTYPQAAKGNTAALDTLALGWYSLDEKGQLLKNSSSGWRVPAGWEKVLEAAQVYDLDTHMVVHITDGGGKLVRFLNNEHAVWQAIDSIAAEAQKYKGVNLDFEGLGWNESGAELIETRQAFSTFVRLLSEELKARDLELVLTLHAPNSAYPGYDYKTLGQIADYIIIMAYDYGPRPEPDDLVIQAVTQACSQVPPEKLILGISAVSEDDDSLESKLRIAQKYRLAGAAVWRLGLITENMWALLATY